MAKVIPDNLMQLGIRRLLDNPLTLKGCGAPVWEAGEGIAGSDRHRSMFDEYVEEVDYVAAIALEWWNKTLAARSSGATNKRAAFRDAWRSRPAGPASYPGLVALVRDFWLTCHALNQEVDEGERVPPWTFLLAWLRDAGHDEAVRVLACMPYWPIGLDEDGNWV